ncbi:MAG: Citrate/H+ symporter of CitMHS family [uncultured Caballeronia sp.]|nr:MAG: Citrate/H+ symporter of CitMHS family [uncultured Caballeronia sp.]
MLKAMAQAAVGFVLPSMATHIPVALGFLSMPLSMLFDPDSFYFGRAAGDRGSGGAAWRAGCACARRRYLGR